MLKHSLDIFHPIQASSCAHLCPHIPGRKCSRWSQLELSFGIIFSYVSPSSGTLTLCLSEGQTYRHFKLKINIYKAEICLYDKYKSIQNSEHFIISWLCLSYENFPSQLKAGIEIIHIKPGRGLQGYLLHPIN